MIKQVMTNVYEKNRFLRLLALKMGVAPSVLSISNQISSSRFVEYPWILSNFDLKKYHRVLDVGSVGSTLPLELGCQGCEVHCIDVRFYEYAKILPNVTSFVGDIRQTEFQSDFFDCVTAVSTIEHIGLGRYSDATGLSGDKKTMDEIRRILKKDGDVLLTMPFGRHAVTATHRVYDSSSINNLVDGFSVVKTQYFSKKAESWFPCSIDEIRDVDSTVSEKGIICLKLRK